MRRTMCLSLGALATILLGACGQIDPAPERGAEEGPPQGSQVTLPPEWTPTADVLASPLAEPTRPRPRFAPHTLTAQGPWVLFCSLTGPDSIGTQASAMDLDGPGRLYSGVPCPLPQHVSGPAGFAFEGTDLLQLPGGEQLRSACCEEATWSEDGSLALLSDTWLSGDRTQLVVYDVAADRMRRIVQSRFQLTPMGVSPSGSWVVYQESDEYSQALPTRQPPVQVMAISSDGRERRDLYGVYGAVHVADSVLGWLTESTLLIQRAETECGLDAQYVELLSVDLNSGATRRLFDTHSYAALDPATQTVLLQEVQPGLCSEPRERVRLVRLTAADGWEPHTAELPSEWSNDWTISLMQWHPELRQFSLSATEVPSLPPQHLITLDPDGSIGQDFPLHGADIPTTPTLFPSPDGAWIVVSASPPHGTRLYGHDGRLIKVLPTEAADVSYGIWEVLWLPDGDAFLATMYGRIGVLRAAAAEDWELTLVEQAAAPESSLTLIEAPGRPFRVACSGWAYTRLEMGDRVMVSYEPSAASRLRSGPALTEPLVDSLDPGEEAEIIGGPACDPTHVWWMLQPSKGGPSGWAAEGDAEGAWLLPIERGP